MLTKEDFNRLKHVYDVSETAANDIYNTFSDEAVMETCKHDFASTDRYLALRNLADVAKEKLARLRGAQALIRRIGRVWQD